MDKIARIRQEIERRANYSNKLSKEAAKKNLRATMEANDLLVRQYNSLLLFLDTLSEEPCKSLEEEISRTYHDGSVTDTEDIDHVAYENISRHFAQWGAEHLRDSTKNIDKSLEEAAEEYRRESFKKSVMPQIDGPVSEYGGNIKNAFIAGWKCRDDQMPMPEDTVLFQKGVAEGRRLEREDMMHDALEGEAEELYNDGESQCTVSVGTYFKPGDKVYVLKAEEE